VRAALVRIDDRLVHGQVLVAWAAALRPDRIVLANDAVALDPGRRALYAGMEDTDFAVSVWTLEEAARAMEFDPERGERVLVVVGSAADADRLSELGAPLRHLNIGGLHLGDAKREFLPYVFLSREDALHLRALLDRGVEIEARDLPGGRGVRLDAAGLDRLWP
jgi:mannose/fructose/N-acetylgalactosamine-specific phosphotransferase system component IIB